MNQANIESNPVTCRAQRIMLCPSSYFPHWGGVEELTKNLAAELIKHGKDVVIVTNRHPSDLPDSENLDGVVVKRFQFLYPARNLAALLAMFKGLRELIRYISFIRSFRPDVVHVICGGPNCFYTWLAHQCLKFPLAFSSCGELFMDAHQIYARSRFANWAFGRLVQACRCVTGVSDYVLKDLCQRFYLPGTVDKRVIYPSIYCDQETQKNHIEQASHYGKFVFAIGRFVENKGFAVLIRAFAKIAAEVPDLNLVIAGRGELYGELLSLTKTLGLENRIHIVDQPARSLVLALYELAEFFVIPSPCEPFAISPLEAMRAGRAIIATTGGGSPELFVNANIGFAVAPNDADAMAGALRKLATNAEERLSMGRAAKHEVQRYDWRPAIIAYLSVYEICTAAAIELPTA